MEKVRLIQVSAGEEPPKSPGAALDQSGVRALHAFWRNEPFGALMLWGEGAATRKDGPSGRGVAPHPFALPARDLARTMPELANARPVSVDLALPSSGGRPWPSHPVLQDDIEVPGSLSLTRWSVPGLSLNAAEALPCLLGLADTTSLRERSILAGQDMLFWLAAARLALDALAEENFLPALAQSRRGDPAAVWRILWETPDMAEKLQALAQALPAACLSHRLDPETGRAVATAEALVRGFVGSAVDAQLRGAASGLLATGAGPGTSHDTWLRALSAPSAFFESSHAEAESLRESLSSWSSRLQTSCAGGIRTCLRLKAPADGVERWTLEILIQAVSDPSFMVSAAEVWASAPSSRKLAQVCGSEPEERLLAALAMASRVFPPLERGLRRAKPVEVILDTAQAYQFLKEAAPLLSDSGFGVLLPPWWKPEQRPKLGVAVKLRPKPGQSAVGLEAILEFDCKVAMGGHFLSAKELAALSAIKVGLVKIRGEWVEADPEALAKALESWQKAAKDGLTFGGFMRRMGEAAKSGLPVLNLQAEGWLGRLLNNDGDFKLRAAPSSLKGTLRHYQERGLAWLSFLANYGLGACLADDMGLGKSIQSLAFLLREKEEGRLKAPALLLCPTSVVGNWESEARRFAPSLRVMVHHGADRHRSGRAFLAAAAGTDIVLSTYALARRDAEFLAGKEWSGILLDEAQNIKNPLARQSLAVRGLKGRFRIALTGTPVENRLSDLWSIMEFLNPGFLGGFDEFQNRFALPIELLKHEAAASTLRLLTQPFILRRLKSDPAIVPDLPAKMEMTATCSITKEQATLYEAVVSDMMSRIACAELGIERAGQVLAALTKLKQVLNHPAQFLKDRSALAGRSGKLERLIEMLEEALAEGDSALIFTQYAEMGFMIKRHLQNVLLEEALFLHGGVPRDGRDAMVRKFQAGGARIMILTLKAGGMGLNLTRANRVFLFDRWWNPAVENQAMDRAYRIGQTKKVLVHKFLCAGTLEEKIAEILEAKKALADRVVGSGEAWLTKLGNKELRELFELRAGALGA